MMNGPEPDEYSFRRYLAAKRTVDDRALDRHTLGQFARELPESAEILEVGAGIGTMLERLLSWELLPDEVRYTALDVDEENLDAARNRLRTQGFTARAGQHVRDGVTVEFVTGDAISFARETDRRWDALVGCAFLDLFDVDEALPALLSAVEPGGVCYFPVTFDGRTAFEPSRSLDDRVERRYHRCIDANEGSSRAGTELSNRLPVYGAQVLADGDSDWNVVPRESAARTRRDGQYGRVARSGRNERSGRDERSGRYPGDEAYFLHHVLRFVAGALGEIEERKGESGAWKEDFGKWVTARRRQVEDGELSYRASNRDVLARRED